MSDDRWGLDDFNDIPEGAIGAEDGAFDLHVRTAVEMMAIPEPPAENVLLGPLVYRGSRTIIVGDTGHGKTTLSLQMIHAILSGADMFGHTGAGIGPILVIDLEQGIRSIQRGLTESKLADRPDLLYASIPDGLALDRDYTQLEAIDATCRSERPVAVLLDPYYKAHRADDPNSERPIVDLMRTLDGLRARHGFALLMPAHPRKADPRAVGHRRLTIHDIAGSGAVTRGAEIVLGIERLGSGAARLRYLKDRDGDLPVGETTQLIYTKGEGFRADSREKLLDDELRARIKAKPRPWMTVAEWRDEVGGGIDRVRAVLALLHDKGDVAYMEGPPGRHGTAKCYGTELGCWVQQSSPVQLPLETEGEQVNYPPFIEGGSSEFTRSSENGQFSSSGDSDWNES